MFAEHNPTRHDRESVTDAALRLLDEVGLPDLSMRRLAAELGVQPSALYWHFESKQALLAAVADRILARVGTIEPTSGSAEPVLATARAIRDALFTYRDGAEVVMSSYALGLGADQAREHLVAALGDDGADAESAATVLLQFILGHALLVQQRMHAESHGAAGATDAADASAPWDSAFDLGIRAFSASLRDSPR